MVVASPALVGLEILRIVSQNNRYDAWRNHSIIRQSNPVTCGPAAVATLFTFYFKENSTEEEMAKLSGTYEQKTTTLLGLRNACRAKDHEATGYRMTLLQLLHQIETSGVPVVAHLKEPSLHYVLVIGKVRNVILVSDPTVGNISVDAADFERQWSGVALVVRPTSNAGSSRVLIDERKKSAEARLEILHRAATLMSSTRFY